LSSWYVWKNSILNLFFLNLGHYCPNPSGNPIPCQPGYANDKHGRVECDFCPKGSYTDVAGLAYCINCPPGYDCTSNVQGKLFSYPIP
jgi:hypothetical protein